MSSVAAVRVHDAANQRISPGLVGCPGLLLCRDVCLGVRFLRPVGLFRRSPCNARLAGVADRLGNHRILSGRRGAADPRASGDRTSGFPVAACIRLRDPWRGSDRPESRASAVATLSMRPCDGGWLGSHHNDRDRDDTGAMVRSPARPRAQSGTERRQRGWLHRCAAAGALHPSHGHGARRADPRDGGFGNRVAGGAARHQGRAVRQPICATCATEAMRHAPI